VALRPGTWMVCLLGIYGSSGFTGSVAHQPIVAAERKAIQSFRPSDFTTAFGRAEGFSRRGGSGVLRCAQGQAQQAVP
jgi:hypothetical protein